MRLNNFSYPQHNYTIIYFGVIIVALTIVHSNDLVEASYNLSLDEMRLICFVASKVDSRKPNIGEIKIYPNDFAKAFAVDPHNMHRNLIQAIKSLANKSVTMRYDERNNIVLPWLSMGIYSRQPDENSHVVVEFSSRIEPYLFELKDRFTAINFEYAARLNTPFSFRLYQWLIKAKKLHKHQQGEAVVVELAVEWMKSQAGMAGLYERWDIFKDKVIKPAIEKINQHTDISVIWQPIRTAKKITAVRFIYSPEVATQAKPLRPRLHRRPKAEKGSYQEGAWLKNNKKLLLDYEQALKQYDPKAKLDIADLRRLVVIYESLGECAEIHADYQQRLLELKERSKSS